MLFKKPSWGLKAPHNLSSYRKGKSDSSFDQHWAGQGRYLIFTYSTTERMRGLQDLLRAGVRVEGRFLTGQRLFEREGLRAPEGFGTKRRRPTPKGRPFSIWAAVALLMLLYSRPFNCRTASLLAAAHTGFLPPADRSESRDLPCYYG